MSVRVNLPNDQQIWTTMEFPAASLTTVEELRTTLVETGALADVPLRFVLNGRLATGATRIQERDELAFWREDQEGTLISETDTAIVPSPSGLPTQHLVTGRHGSTGLFVGQQWLQSGEQVFLHTHPCDEVLTWLSGSGEATLGTRILPIGPGSSLFIPAGVVHGFRNIGQVPMQVMIVFPVPEFAPTGMIDEPEQQAGQAGSETDS